MGVLLVGSDERYEIEVDECTFYYRRLPGDRKATIIKKNTKRGITDENGVSEEALLYGLLDWDGVTAKKDGEEVPIEFHRKLVIMLPQGVKNEVAEAIIDGRLSDLNKVTDAGEDETDPT